MYLAIGVEFATNPRDASVHHVGRRNDVSPGLRMAQRLASQCLEGFVVQHVARLVDQAVLAVACVGVERDIGYHTEIRQRILECPHDARHQPTWVPGLGGIETLLLGFDHRKQRQRRNAQ